MKTAMKRLGTAVVIFGVWGASTASAGLLDNCNGYAQASAKQEQENKLRKCNLKGDFWTTDLKKHVTYCKTVPPQKWKASLAERQKQLSACK